MKGHYTFTDQETGEQQPIQTEEDASQMTDITKRVLDLPKYQKVITDLKREARDSSVGILNFVTGQEASEIIDSILLSAFPPSSGRVYRSQSGGYGVDCSSWGDEAGCAKNFLTTLKGDPEVFTADDYQALQKDMEGVKHSEDIFQTLSDGATMGGSSAPAQPSASGGAAGFLSNQMQGANVTVEEKLAQREKLMEGLRDLRKKFISLDPYENERARARLTTLYSRLKGFIAKLDSTLPNFVDDNLNPRFDGTGFMDFRPQVPPQLMSQLEMISSEEKLAKKLNESLDAVALKAYEAGERPQGPKVQPEERAKIASQIIERLDKNLGRCAQSVPVKLQKTIEEIREGLSGGLAGIPENREKISRAVSQFKSSVEKQQGVMILRNVSDSKLVSYPEGGRDVAEQGTKQMRFNFRPFVANEFVKPTVRQDKAIVFVSQTAVNFGMTGVKYVELPEGITEEESAQILDSEIKSFIKEAGMDPDHVYLLHSQIKKLKALILGRPHSDAISLLRKGLLDAEEESGGSSIQGDILIKLLRNRVNSETRATLNGMGGGAAHGMELKEPKINKDTYIYQKKTTWGDFVEQNVVEAAKDVKDMQTAQANFQKQLNQAIQEGNNEASETLSSNINAITNDIQTILNGIPHFLILYGEASSGKSSFAEMLADLLGLSFYDVDLGQAKGMYVGMTEHQTRMMVDSWGNMSDAVLRFDEFDGQMPTDEAASKDSHSGTSVKQLLTFFQDKVKLLKARNVFFVATTNNPGNIRSQLFSRAQHYEVPLPLTAEGYTEFLTNATERMRGEQDLVMSGRFHYKGQAYELYTPEDAWAFVQKVWDENVDIKTLAEALAANPVKVDFRNLIVQLMSAFGIFNKWLRSNEALRLYNEDLETFATWFSSMVTRDDSGKIIDVKKPEILGFELNTYNLIEAFNRGELKEIGGYGTNISERKTVKTNGVYTWAREVSNKRKEETQDPNQMELFGPDQGQYSANPQEEVDEDILTVAKTKSTDHYMSVLSGVNIKSPVAPSAPQLQNQAPAVQESVPEVAAPQAGNSMQVIPTLAEKNGQYFEGSFAMGPCNLSIEL